ncbi:MAG: ubiquinol-cytochrome c reductase iron-sulfur subunit [Desulfomonilaceae bacterium]
MKTPEKAAGRRFFLKLIISGLISTVALMLTWGIGRFAFFRGQKNIKRELHPEILDTLQVGIPLHVPEAGAWILKTEGVSPKLTAFDDRCTHLGCRQKWNQEKGLFECPCHGSEFDLEGRVKRGPANRSLPRFSFSRSEENKTRLLEISADGLSTS